MEIHRIIAFGLYILNVLSQNLCFTQFYNGDFNIGSNNCVGPTGWRTNNSQVSDLFQANDFWVDITGCTYGNGNWIEQDIRVTPGKIYYIRVDLGTWSEWDDEDAGVDVFINGVQLGNRLFNDEFSKVPGWRLFWKKKIVSCSFIPATTQVTVRLTGHSRCTPTSPPAKCASPAPGVIAVDNVELDSFEVSLPEKVCLFKGDKLTYSILGKPFPQSCEWWFNNQLLSSDSIITPQSSGVYTLKVNINCTQFETTVLVDTVTIEKRGYSICKGDSVYVNKKYVKNSGIFYDTVHYTDKCSKIIESTVKLGGGPNNVYKNRSNYICPKTSDTVVLDPGPGYKTYLWSPSGASTRTLKVWNPGIVSVVLMKDSGNCPDSMVFYIGENCLPDCFIPNAFTPNGDGSNDYFPPYLAYVKSYSLKIFNRWGELLYESNDPKLGWDGKYKGELCQESVYVFILSFDTQQSNSTYLFEGTFTLLR